MLSSSPNDFLLSSPVLLPFQVSVYGNRASTKPVIPPLAICLLASPIGISGFTTRQILWAVEFHWTKHYFTFSILVCFDCLAGSLVQILDGNAGLREPSYQLAVLPQFQDVIAVLVDGDALTLPLCRDKIRLFDFAPPRPAGVRFPRRPPRLLVSARPAGLPQRP